MNEFQKYLFTLFKDIAGTDLAVEYVIKLLTQEPYNYTSIDDVKKKLHNCQTVDDVEFALTTISVSGCSTRMIAREIFNQILKNPKITSVVQPHQTTQSHFSQEIHSIIDPKRLCHDAVEKLLSNLRQANIDSLDMLKARVYAEVGQLNNADDIEKALNAIGCVNDTGFSTKGVAGSLDYAFKRRAQQPVTSSTVVKRDAIAPPSVVSYTQSSVKHSNPSPEATDHFKLQLTQSLKALPMADASINSFIEWLKRNGVDSTDTCRAKFGKFNYMIDIVDKINSMGITADLPGFPVDAVAPIVYQYSRKDSQIAATVQASKPSSNSSQQSVGQQATASVETSEEKRFKEALLSLDEKGANRASIQHLINKLTNLKLSNWPAFSNKYESFITRPAIDLMTSLVNNDFLPPNQTDSNKIIADFLHTGVANRIKFRREVTGLLLDYYPTQRDDKIKQYIDLMATHEIETWDNFYEHFYFFKKSQDMMTELRRLDLLLSEQFSVHGDHPGKILHKEMRKQQEGFVWAVRNALSQMKDPELPKTNIDRFIENIAGNHVDCWNRFIAEFGHFTDIDAFCNQMNLFGLMEGVTAYDEYQMNIAKALIKFINKKFPGAIQVSLPSFDAPSTSGTAKPNQSLFAANVEQPSVAQPAAPAQTQSQVSSSIATGAAPVASLTGTSGTKPNSPAEKQSPQKSFGQALRELLTENNLLTSEQAMSIVSHLASPPLHITNWFAMDVMFESYSLDTLIEFHDSLCSNGVFRGCQSLEPQVTLGVASVLINELVSRRMAIETGAPSSASSKQPTVSVASCGVFAPAVSDLKVHLDIAAKDNPEFQSAVKQFWSNLQGKKIATLSDLEMHLKGCSGIHDVYSQLEDPLLLLEEIKPAFKQPLASIIWEALGDRLIRQGDPRAGIS